jgi:hypothetical protein
MYKLKGCALAAIKKKKNSLKVVKVVLFASFYSIFLEMIVKAYLFFFL